MIELLVVIVLLFAYMLIPLYLIIFTISLGWQFSVWSIKEVRSRSIQWAKKVMFHKTVREIANGKTK